MQKTLKRFCILLKNNLLSKTFYITVILMFIGCISIKEYQNNINNAPKVCGIYEKDSNTFNDKLSDVLTCKNEFLHYDNYDSLVKDIKCEKICCGFVLQGNIEDFNPKTYEGYSVNYISTNRLKEAEAFKEMFFDCFLNEYNNILITYFSREIIENSSEEIENNIIDLKEQYMNSERLFSVSLKYIDSDNEEHLPLVYPIKGVIATCIFLAALFTGLSFYSDETKVILNTFVYSERTGAKVLYLLSFILPIAVFGLVFQLIFDRGNAWENIIRLIVLIIYSVLWTMFVQYIFKKSKTYSALIFTIIPLIFLMCPIIINAETYIPALKYIKYIIPVSVYL